MTGEAHWKHEKNINQKIPPVDMAAAMGSRAFNRRAIPGVAATWVNST
jgi:hypothetical protein